METPPTIQQPIDTTAQDDLHFKIVVILKYVYTGIICLGICVGMFYVMLGLALGSGMLDPELDSDQEAEFVGTLFYYVGIGVTLISLVMAILVFISARHISKRKHRTFSFVVAAICCLNLPLGTALGIYTIIVLLRPGVIAQYQQASLGNYNT